MVYFLSFLSFFFVESMTLFVGLWSRLLSSPHLSIFEYKWKTEHIRDKLDYSLSSPSETSKKVSFAFFSTGSSAWLSPVLLIFFFTFGLVDSLTFNGDPTNGYRSCGSITTWKIGCSTIIVPLRLSDRVFSKLIGWNLKRKQGIKIRNTRLHRMNYWRYLPSILTGCVLRRKVEVQLFQLRFF